MGLETAWRNYWGAVVLALWVIGFVTLPIASLDVSGIDEGAARGLLLNWAIADRVINPIVILGMPDFRAALFAPLAIYWPGSIIAAKVFVAMVFAIGALMLFRWTRARFGDETATLGVGLLLIAPLTFAQIDALATGPFLLAGMAVLWRIEESYIKGARAVGGLYYLRLLLIATLATLHPAGLGYPMALIWHWSRNPTGNEKQRTQVIGGIVITLIVIGVMRAGWIDLPWGAHPVAALSTILDMPNLDETPEWPLGVIPLAALIAIIVGYRRQWLTDTPGLGWVLAIALGALSADGAWALLALAFILIYGTAALAALHARIRLPNFVGQRGIMLLLVFVLSIVFMREDKSLHDLHSANVMSSQDRLLRVLATEIEGNKERVATASQWPGKTMLACRCEVLPLPPPRANAAEFAQSLQGLRYMIFDPSDHRQRALAQRVAESNALLKTVAMEDNSVLLEIVPTTNTPPAAPTATPRT